MIKTLRPIGNSLGLIIDKAILDLLEIDRTTRLDLKIEGNRLYIEPLSPDRVAPPRTGLINSTTK